VSKKREYRWEVVRLKASPAAFLGSVYAPDEEAALEKAIEEFEVPPHLQDRLLARRAG
jgi:1,2-phenylacetyl-CoA epoxidase PaaB subunit